MPDGGKKTTDAGLPISKESRVVLGLEPSGAVRTVAQTGRMTLLETGDSRQVPLPSDRDLVLSSDVRSFALGDLLSLVHDSGKSGLLLFEFQHDEKAVYLSRGEVVFAASNLPADRLAVCLLRSGLIDVEQLAIAEDRYHPGTRFGKVVVEQGFLTPRDLWNGVKTQVEEIVRSLFSYSAGWIHFWEGEIEPDNVVRLSLPTKRLIGEGLARRDELMQFMAMIEDARTRIRPVSQQRPVISESERAVIDALAEIGERRGVQEEPGLGDFQKLCHRSGLDPRSTARTLQFMWNADRVEIEQGELGAGGDYTAADHDVIREAVALHGKLIVELTAPLVALDGVSAVSARLNRIREESAAGGRRLLDSLEFNSAAALDPTELEYRALRLPGDRLRELDEALGEIVAYLEFELKNHPQIEDSGPFLEAVDPLRAMLIR
jgi:hypothetical protein